MSKIILTTWSRLFIHKKSILDIESPLEALISISQHVNTQKKNKNDCFRSGSKILVNELLGGINQNLEKGGLFS